MLILELTPALKRELVSTIFEGCRSRVVAGHPPSDELRQLVKAISSGQQSSAVVNGRQGAAHPGESAQDVHEAPASAVLLTRPEAAQRLNVSVSTVDRLRRLGRLEAVRVGGRGVRFRRDDIEAFGNAEVVR